MVRRQRPLLIAGARLNGAITAGPAITASAMADASKSMNVVTRPVNARLMGMGGKMKTITRSELARLAFCNSIRLPRKVNVDGRLLEWVGVGWIDVGPVNRRYPTMLEEATS